MHAADSCLRSINITTNRNGTGSSLAWVSVQKVLEKPFKGQAIGIRGKRAATTPGFHFPLTANRPAGKIMSFIPLARAAPWFREPSVSAAPQVPRPLAFPLGKGSGKRSFIASATWQRARWGTEPQRQFSAFDSRIRKRSKPFKEGTSPLLPKLPLPPQNARDADHIYGIILYSNSMWCLYLQFVHAGN